MPTPQISRMVIGPNPAVQSVQSLGFLVGILIGLGLASGFTAAAFRDRLGQPVAPPDERVNPNDAPIVSLIRLPGVGLTRARAIVAYRDHIRAQPGRPAAFASPDDLQRVKGIGPAIVNDIRPWLQFDIASADIDTTSPR